VAAISDDETASICSSSAIVLAVTSLYANVHRVLFISKEMLLVQEYVSPYQVVLFFTGDGFVICNLALAGSEGSDRRPTPLY
jgi:hypothetical protein